MSSASPASVACESSLKIAVGESSQSSSKSLRSSATRTRIFWPPEKATREISSSGCSRLAVSSRESELEEGEARAFWSCLTFLAWEATSCIQKRRVEMDVLLCAMF